MKIVLYTHTFLPTIGGRELVVHYLARALMELGQDVRVVGVAGARKYLQTRFPYVVHRYPGIFRGRLLTQSRRARLRESELVWKLRIDARIWGCDVINAHHAYPGGYVAARALAGLTGTGLVITPHGDDVNVLPDIDFGMRLNPRLNPKIEQALTAAHCVTTISAGIEQSTLDTGVDSNKLRRIPNGVDIGRYSRCRRGYARDRFGLPSEARMIVTVGNYHPRKGHEYLIRAMPEIIAETPQAYLIIVGRNTESLISLIDDLSLRERVILAGQVPFPSSQLLGGRSDEVDQLADIYGDSELYVSAGVGEGAEGLSLAVLEAMAAGLPVVGTDIAGNHDVIADGMNGRLVATTSPKAIADAVNGILSDDHVRASMSEHARRDAQRFAWTEIAKQYVEVYEQSRVMAKDIRA